MWPGVVAALLLWLGRFGLKAVIPGIWGFGRAVPGGLLAAVAVILWWALLSRAAWFERLGAITLMVAAMGATWGLKHESMGPLWLVAYAIPVLCLAFVASAVASRRLADGPRRATMAATILLACGVWTLVRTEGIRGDYAAKFAWRWTKSPEERLLAQAGAAPVAPPPALASTKPGADWPGFRGPQRDGVIRGVRIETNWSTSPPVELWRRPVGPGWSSFAVRGNLLYTQEQRGDEEVVACYNLTTGEPVWRHGDAARFFESNAGAGPRATPTLSDGRVYTFGATGILNALDADDGAAVWSRNVASDTGATVPYWGFSRSGRHGSSLIWAAASRSAFSFPSSSASASSEVRERAPMSGERNAVLVRLGHDGVEHVRIDGLQRVLGPSPVLNHFDDDPSHRCRPNPPTLTPSTSSSSGCAGSDSSGPTAESAWGMVASRKSLEGPFSGRPRPGCRRAPRTGHPSPSDPRGCRPGPRGSRPAPR